MKLVGVLDTFFILSLGITFVLLLVLVYHFRKRLNENELKYDKLLIIVNDIVQKLNEQQLENDNRNMPSGNSVEMMSDMSPDMMNAIRSGLIDIRDLPIPRNIDNFNDEQEEYEEETDEDGEDDEAETEDDDDAVSEGEEEETEDVDEETEDVDEETEDVDEEGDEEEEIKMINISDEVIVDNNIDSEYIDEVEEGPIDEQEVDIEPLEETDPVNVIKTNIIDYSSMNVSELKKIVKDKNLSTNISKLKKQELIDLLVSE